MSILYILVVVLQRFAVLVVVCSGKFSWYVLYSFYLGLYNLLYSYAPNRYLVLCLDSVYGNIKLLRFGASFAQILAEPSQNVETYQQEILEIYAFKQINIS